MEFALGILHYPPDAFWRMTLLEYDAALAGHNRFYGGGEEEVDIGRARRFIAEAKRQFPDQPQAARRVP
jgi:hypothetical protein